MKMTRKNSIPEEELKRFEKSKEEFIRNFEKVQNIVNNVIKKNKTNPLTKIPDWIMFIVNITT
jgi:hypothetical protein